MNEVWVVSVTSWDTECYAEGAGTEVSVSATREGALRSLEEAMKFIASDDPELIKAVMAEVNDQNWATFVHGDPPYRVDSYGYQVQISRREILS